MAVGLRTLNSNMCSLLIKRSGALLQFQPSTRLMSGQGQRDCAEDTMPKCGKEQLAKKKECQEEKKDKGPFASMWENPECCKDPCPDVMPRFDELYYKISDKGKKKYTQTWVECPRLKIAKRKICCFENVKYPPIKRRTFKRSKAGANCEGDKLLMLCKGASNSKCPKITLPGCRGARDPPRCLKERGPSNCKKICCPYPSFSECKKPAIKPLRIVECRCLDIPSMCEVWARFRRLAEIGA